MTVSILLICDIVIEDTLLSEQANLQLILSRRFRRWRETTV